MILYHFTAEQHIEKILADGVINLTESNISPRRAHAGPDVVWLTKNGEWPDVPAGKVGFNGLSREKTQVRITVDVARPIQWRRWAESHGISKTWLSVLAGVGGSYSWYVTTSPILEQQWISVDYRRLSEDR
jgi:hypothetical protein